MTAEQQLRALMERGEERAASTCPRSASSCRSSSSTTTRSTALYEQIETRGIELTDDCGRPQERSDLRERRGRGETTDALQLFLNEAGRYPLLTAAEEVELAKRIERGDKAAKDRMVNSNLRLVVSIAKSTRATACRCST